MKKFFKTLLVALLLIPACAWADGWNDAEYQRIEQSIQLPNIKQATKKYVISAYGAKQNASTRRLSTNSSPSFLKKWRYCSHPEGYLAHRSH